MAVYKIFPEKDAFILSQYPAQNTGRGINIQATTGGDLPAVTRALVQFKTSDINDVITNKIGNSVFQSDLKLYMAYAENAPLNYTIEAYPVSGAWDMGTGRVSDIPQTTNGVSWGWRGESGSNAWTTDGGDWYTNKSGSSQDFVYTSNKDISMNVTDMVKLWNSSSIDNNGFIVKHSASIEFSSSYVDTSYFSMDTHTIYPPTLVGRFNIFLITSSCNG